MKNRHIPILALLAFCCIASVSCSTTRNSPGKNDLEHQALVKALDQNNINIGLISTVPSASLPYVDVSGGAYVIRIRGEKATATLPGYDETSRSHFGHIYESNLTSPVNEFNCQRMASTNKHVVYTLTDLYGNLVQKIKIYCYYSGAASVIFESNHATIPTYKYRAELEIPD